MSSAAFDGCAARYDELWTNTDIGRLQRDAVWRHVSLLFQAGSKILDLGCGTGEDAHRLKRRGMEVTAIDASPEMVRIARDRGVDARVLRIEDLRILAGAWDGIISNFGPLNCVERLWPLREPLARLIRPGGHLALCTMGRFCLWETAYYLARAQPAKACRRWMGICTSPSLGVRVFYHSIRRIRQAFAPEFSVVKVAGIGLVIPPSYISGLSSRLLTKLDRLDRRVAHLPLARAMTDHRLVVLVRK